MSEHLEATRRLEALRQELNPPSEMAQIHQELSRLLAPRHEPELRPGIAHGPDLGLDIGF